MSDGNQVARLALVAVGSYFGGPLGAAVGGTVGQLLFPGEIPDVTGPRVNDLRVTSSAYGKDIPEAFGTFRFTGEVIWSTGLIEHKNAETNGGKGGSSRTSTTYSYTSSFAVSLCKGQITEVLRIWADSKLIYDVSPAATADQITASNQLGVSIYIGSEDQLPDAIIQASLGVDNTPAHRGLNYFVFDNLELERYGNRLPSITSEIIGGSVINDFLPLSTVVTNICEQFGLNASDIDVSNLTQLVKGIDKPQAMSGATFLKSLFDAYNVIAYESDWKIVFKTKGSETPELILESELNASESDSSRKSSLVTNRSMEHLLPRRIEVTYYEEGTDYQQANQFAQRIST